jgi:hypothetical protein
MPLIQAIQGCLEKLGIWFEDKEQQKNKKHPRGINSAYWTHVMSLFFRRVAVIAPEGNLQGSLNRNP